MFVTFLFTASKPQHNHSIVSVLGFLNLLGTGTSALTWAWFKTDINSNKFHFNKTFIRYENCLERDHSHLTKKTKAKDQIPLTTTSVRTLRTVWFYTSNWSKSEKQDLEKIKAWWVRQWQKKQRQRRRRAVWRNTDHKKAKSAIVKILQLIRLSFTVHKRNKQTHGGGQRANDAESYL